MAKTKAPAKAPAQPDYLKSLGIQAPDLSGLPQNWDAATKAAVQQYYAPGGGFQQTLATEMQPTGQGGYTVNPAYVDPSQGATPPIAVAHPIVRPPDPVQTQPTPPPPPPPPPQAKMDWAGLASGLQGILQPYLSGGASAAGGNPMGQIMPLLMKSLGGYLGQLQPTMEGQQAAAGQTAAPTDPTKGGTMDWSKLGQTLQGPLTQDTRGQLLNQLLGYMGTLPQTASSGHTGANAAQTALGAISQNVPRYAIG